MAAIPLLEETSGGPSGTHDRRDSRRRGQARRPGADRTAGRAAAAAQAGDLRGVRRLRSRRGTRLSELAHHRAERLLQPVFPGAGHAAPRGSRGQAGGHPRRRRIQEPAAPAGALLGGAAGHSARRADHAHMGEPVRAARHAAARPRRPGRRDRGFLRHAVAAASQAAQGAGAARHAARRTGCGDAAHGGRGARPAHDGDRRGRTAVHRQPARRRSLPEGVAQQASLCASTAG